MPVFGALVRTTFGLLNRALQYMPVLLIYLLDILYF